MFTQEPAWMCGQTPKWIKWHYDTIFNNNSSGFMYTQLGQENGFMWIDKLDNALKYQYEFAYDNKDDYGFEYITFGEMGKRFKLLYKTTPMTCVYALSDWAENGNKSVWFNSKYYRINIFSDDKKVWIRDLQKYDDNQRDVYLDSPCQDSLGVYEALPVMDGVQFSDDEVQAGIYFGEGTISSVSKEDSHTVVEISIDDKKIKLFLKEDLIEVVCDSPVNADFVYMNNCDFIKEISDKEINYKHRNGEEYRITFKQGFIMGNKIFSDKNKIIINLSYPVRSH